MKEHWWKVLGVLLMIYGLTFGLLTPLKPGIPNVYPTNGQTGQTLNLTLEGYNTHFDEAKTTRAWLKLGDRTLLATQTNTTSPTLLTATFEIPKYLPSKDKVVPFTLISDNEIDGASVLPNAVFITQQQVQAELGETLWKNTPIQSLNEYQGFAFPFRNILNETIRNIYYHVSLWFAMFILLAVSMYYTIKYLNKGDLRADAKAKSLTSVAVVFGLLGCVTGSIWAKHTWGTWWTTDVKLNMSAVVMLIYLAYFILRGSFTDETKRAKLASVYSIFAFASIIPLIFVIPRLVDSLHPGNGGNPGLGGDDLDHTMRMIFYPTIIGLTLVGYWISTLIYRLDLLEYKLLDRE